MKTTIHFRDFSLEIHPITLADLDDIFQVYQQCEDFLALGPAPKASREMVLKDIELSRRAGGIFCGIFRADGQLIGIVDYIPGHYQGQPSIAFLELLMIAGPFRHQGIGKAVLEAVEDEIRQDKKVKAILSGVQVNNPQAIKFWQRAGYTITSGPTPQSDQTTVFGLRKDFTIET